MLPPWQRKKSVRNGHALLVLTPLRRNVVLEVKDISDLPPQFHSCEFNIYHCVLKLKSGYVNHHDNTLIHNLDSLPPRPFENISMMCHKLCKSSPGFKRHIKVHEDDATLFDPVNPVKVTTPVCHIYFQPCYSSPGLKSHLRAQAHLQVDN